MQVSGSRVLLTGASGGIGNALARVFAEAGASLVLSGRREVELKELAATTGGTTVIADLADRADVARLLEEAGPVDILVANAALPAAGLLADFTAEQVDRALEVNLRAPIALAHALAPGMVARGSGSLVFVSSLAGLAASRGSSLYNATKFGLRGFALALRQDLHGTGVGVSVVLPGFVRDAGMFADAGGTPPPGFGTRTPQQVARATLHAVHRDKGEVVVAPPIDRVGARVGGLAPGLAARLQRAGGAADLTEQLAEAGKDKR
ncbi:MAG: oxidoreductase [Frankiales bacterium]|nr:oxidoreductase [Frankiales bacterium]